MKGIFAILFMLNFAWAGGCSKKQIETPIPAFPVSLEKNDGWKEAYEDVYRVLCNNLKTPNNFFRGYRAHPGPPYKAAYLWDTAFISLVWVQWEPKVAEELIHYILRFQKPNGKIHHAVVEILVKPHAYSESQPPLLSWAAWEIYEKSKNIEFLKATYPKLKKYHEWLMKERMNSEGLFFWKHPYESGIDNSPRFSNRDESRTEDTTKMAAVDFSSYMALSMESLEKISHELHLERDAEIFRTQYQSLKTRMNKRLWNEADGTYYDWDYRKNDFIKMETISNITPMIAGIPDEKQASRLMMKIMDEKVYNTKIPFPSVARNSSLFIKDMWQGPVWINMAYVGILGVKRYGYKQEARTLSRKLVAGVYETWKNQGYFYEFYDPDRYDIKELHRKKGNLWKKITLGSKPVKNFVGWTGLVNVLVLESE